MFTSKNISAMLKKSFLSPQEITDYVKKYQRSKSAIKKQEYKDMVFQNISRMIAKSASYHSSSRIDTEDLFQAGVIGFCEAIEKFKPKMGNMFTTYLKFWIEKGIYSALYGNNLIYTPRNVISYTNKKMRESKDGEQIKHNKFTQAFVNTTRMLNIDGGVNGKDFKETLRSPVDMGSDIENSIMKSDILNMMDSYLNQRESSVLKLRYLSGNNKTLSEVGKTLSLSTERIRQIETLAISKLRKHI